MAAAIEAIEAGSSVILIDKMSVYGGNSSLNGGDMAAVGTPLQKEAGVEDSTDLMIADMLKAGKKYNHVDRVKAVVENSAAAVEWCTELGVEFTKLNFHGGHSVPVPTRPRTRRGPISSRPKSPNLKSLDPKSNSRRSSKG